MTYSIIGAVTNGRILTTTVTYTFDDNSVQTIDVQHFEPRDQDEVILGVSNRGNLEQTILNNILIITNLLNNNGG